MSREDGGEESAFLCLPPDVVFNILEYCDNKTLGRLSLVCKRLHFYIAEDYVWIAKSRKALVTNKLSEVIQKRSCCFLSAREKCRISANWKHARYHEEAIISHRSPYMPWLQLCSGHLWYTKGSTILCFPKTLNGLVRRSVLSLKGHMDDVCRFVCKESIVVSGGRDGAICGWREADGRFIFSRRRSHNSDVNSVDVHRNIIVSGSRDKSVKVWTLQNYSLVFQQTLHMRDRVWDVAILPSGRYMVTGSAGYSAIPPLQLFDLERCTRIASLGSNYKNGAGVLNVYAESSVSLLSCGYDTYIRLWDIRCPTHCVLQWEDPHDSAVYCVTTDHQMTVLSGTARHGLVRLWDKRMTKAVQMYYVGRGNSPVYCVTFDPCHLYVALDTSLNMLSFSGYHHPANSFNDVITTASSSANRHHQQRLPLLLTSHKHTTQ